MRPFEYTRKVPSTYPDKPILSHNYATLLRDKHNISGEILDLDNAIQGVWDAIALAGANNPKKRRLHGILANETVRAGQRYFVCIRALIFFVCIRAQTILNSLK